MTPYHGKPGEVIDPKQVDVFRGGDDWTVKPVEVKLIGGLVQPTHGVSRETDPTTLTRFGGAKKILSIPDDLQIIQRGRRATHFEVVPKKPVPFDEDQELVDQIETE